MTLARIDHITLPPPLLETLARAPLVKAIKSLFDCSLDENVNLSLSVIQNKDSFEKASDASQGGVNGKKLDQVSVIHLVSALLF